MTDQTIAIAAFVISWATVFVVLFAGLFFTGQPVEEDTEDNAEARTYALAYSQWCL